MSVKWVGMFMVLGGCAVASHKPLVESLPASRPAGCPLKIFLEGTLTEDKLVPVCAIAANDPDLPWARSEPQWVMDEIFSRACGCGAQAIVVRDYNGAYLQVLAVANSPSVPGIGLERLKKLMNCRFRQGTWTKDGCHMIKRTGRERPNPRGS